MALEWRGAHSGRKSQIGMFPDGMGTDFYGAVDWAAGYIRGEKGRKGVIVFSDGLQSAQGSRVSYRSVLQRLRQSSVPFYFIGTSDRNEGAPLMKELAEASGGRAYFPRQPQDMVAVYEQIGRDLGRAYTLSYAPSRAPDGRFRKIEVKPIDVRLRIAQSRDGYYAH
jgi:VWFA-related protein